MVQIRRPKKPYAAGRAEFAAAKGLPTATGEVPRNEPRGSAVSPAQAMTPVRRQKKMAGGKAVRLQFRIHAPAAGTYAYFDRAASLMGPGKALRRILTRALEHLEGRVQAGEPIAAASYPVDRTTTASMTRHVSPDVYAAAKRTFDPMNLDPEGTVGRELATAALASYLPAAAADMTE